MQWFFLFLGLAFVTQVWLCIRVGRSNVPLAILTLLIGFPGALYTFFSERGNKETSVAIPFVANLICCLVFIGSIWFIVIPALDAQQAKEAAESGLTLTPAAPVRAAAAAAAEPAASASTATASAVAASATVSAIDSVDAFSAALKASGLNHSVTRLEGPALPTGITDGAVFKVAPLSSGSATGNELSATLFRCATAAACRNLAGLHMQQSESARKRVLPKGLLLLSLPAEVQDGDLTPAAVASAFRKL